MHFGDAHHHGIVIPPAVMAIMGAAFYSCSQLSFVILGEGLEVIGEAVFCGCTSLHEIIIPLAVKAITEEAFACCSQLVSVILGEGLEEKRGEAFLECALLQNIVIPRAVKKVHDDALKDCSNLTSIVFCNEIEEIVSSDSMRTWWNQGFHERSLTTYSFLVRFNIQQRLGSVLVRSWRDAIHNMLRRIPTIPYKPKNTLNACYNFINS